MGVLRRSTLYLEQAFHDTANGNQRLQSLGIAATELTGDGSFLTPRMLHQAKKSHQSALELASDSLNVTWEVQREEQWSKYLQAKKDKAAKEAEATAEAGPADGGTQPPTP